MRKVPNYGPLSKKKLVINIKMDIEKYKEKLEAAIYECCGKYYIGSEAIEEVLREYISDQPKLDKSKIDLIFSDLKNEVITEKQAHQRILSYLNL